MKLTRRQNEVLDLIQRGASNKQIGARLNLSQGTIKVHVSNLLKKYGVQTRTQLAMYSSQNKVIKLPDMPEDVEPDAFAWVHMHGDKVIGVIFSRHRPKEGWEPLYKKQKRYTP